MLYRIFRALPLIRLLVRFPLSARAQDPLQAGLRLLLGQLLRKYIYLFHDRDVDGKWKMSRFILFHNPLLRAAFKQRGLTDRPQLRPTTTSIHWLLIDHTWWCRFLVLHLDLGLDIASTFRDVFRLLLFFVLHILLHISSGRINLLSYIGIVVIKLILWGF